MRKLVALSIIAMSLLFGAPSAVLAQSAGSISGEAVDAGGRGVTQQRVELVQNGHVLQTTMTVAGGAFTFANVAPGDYIVRVMINNQPAGIKVSLASGSAIANATIVTPSAAKPSGPFIVPILIPLLIAAGVGVTVATVAVVTGS